MSVARSTCKITQYICSAQSPYIIVVTIQLCQGFLEEDGPENAATFRAVSKSNLTRLVNWYLIVNHNLLLLTVLREFKGVDAMFTGFL